MRHFPVSYITGVPRLSGRMGLLLPMLAGLSLAGCFGEDQKRQTTGEQVPVTERIDRSHKGDRLVATQPPRLTTLDEARRAAMRAFGRNNNAPLSKFYRALSGLQSGLRSEPVTILHLGDSHIAADRFSGDLRALFQKRFGNAGRGSVMPGYPFPWYRARGVDFAKEGSWSASNSFQGDPGKYGLSGVRLTAGGKGAKLTMTSTQGAAEWAEVSFLTQPGGGRAIVTFGGEQREVSTSGAESGLRRVRFNRKGRELSIVSKDEKPVSILSMSTGQNRPGVRYVNFGIPGATADTTALWDDELVADGLAHHKPDLIVLGYGTNEGFNDGLDGAAYAKRYKSLVKRMKRETPQASFLIIGPPDVARFPRFARKSKSIAANASCRPLISEEVRNYSSLKAKKSSQLARWHAPPNITVVRAALERVAREEGAYFWDWSQVMGGPCGIHKWVQADPPLAASDHVHLRSAGAKRSAEALFDDLMSGYDAHVRLASR